MKSELNWNGYFVKFPQESFSGCEWAQLLCRVRVRFWELSWVPEIEKLIWGELLISLDVLQNSIWASDSMSQKLIDSTQHLSMLTCELAAEILLSPKLSWGCFLAKPLKISTLVMELFFLVRIRRKKWDMSEQNPWDLIFSSTRMQRWWTGVAKFF